MTTQENDEFSPRQFFNAWWFSLLILCIILILSAMGESTSQALSLNKAEIANGEWWRFFSCHFVHLSLNHTLLNATGYIILCFGFRNAVTAIEEMFSLFIAMLGVSAGLLLFSPEIGWYVGLSGAIYGLLVSNALKSAQSTPFLSGFFLFFIVTKIIYEQWFAAPDRATEALIGGEVAVDSHLYGVIAGLFPGFFWFFRNKK